MNPSFQNARGLYTCPLWSETQGPLWGGADIRARIPCVSTQPGTATAPADLMSAPGRLRMSAPPYRGQRCIASERVARASHRADDHLVDVHIRRLLDRVAHRIGDRVGVERDAAQLVHGRFCVVN